MGGNPLTQQERALKKLNARDVSRKGAAHPIFAAITMT